SAKDIKTAYRKLARKYHPDVNPGNTKSEAQFKEIGEAYAVLSDPEKRKKYDRWGPDWEKIEQAQAAGANFRGRPGSSSYTWSSAGNGGAPGGINFESDDLGGLFEQLFGGEGDDLRVKVPTPLYTAILGGEVMVPTPKGSQLALKVPPETANGQRMRLAGQGMPHVNGSGRGDLYAEVSIQLPRNLTTR